jgi:hypothetical protein
MSEEVNAGSGENPGKMKGIIGFVISLVAIVLGGSIMGWLFVAAGFSKGAAAIGFLFPIAGIVISVMGMKESKAAGHKNGLGLTGMIISIVAIVWLLMVFAGLSLLAGAADNMQELGNALQNLENVGH